MFALSTAMCLVVAQSEKKEKAGEMRGANKCGADSEVAARSQYNELMAKSSSLAAGWMDGLACGPIH